MSRPTSTRTNSSGPRASMPRMILSPFARVLRRLAPVGMPTTVPTSTAPLMLSIYAAFQRLDLSTDPRVTIARIRQHKYTPANTIPLVFLLACGLFDLYMMTAPLIPVKLGIPLLYALVLAFPITNQFFWPSYPILTWVLTFFCARYIPSSIRPGIHVNLLPALESVLYGANISDLQTRYTNQFLDVLAWLPYGVLHFALPVVVALVLWVFGPRRSPQYWGKAFGWMNLIGVLTQILFPCAAPWYEIIHGLTPADYAMPGSPGGLLRIDRVFHSNGYTNTFGSAPLVFGAFPSLHSGCAVMEALFLSHFFPKFKTFYWCYVGILWWATMYLSHHYLIDLTGGACLSVGIFYITMPAKFKDIDQIIWNDPTQSGTGYALIDPSANRGQGEIDFDEEIRKLEEEDGVVGVRDRDEESAIEFEERNGNNQVNAAEGSGRKKNKRSVSWGETKVMGERQGEDAEERREREEAEGDIGRN